MTDGAGVLLQPAGPPAGSVDPAVGVGGSAVGAFLTTLIVGAILVALAPEYTRRMMADVTEEIVESFVYGFVALLALVVLTVLLVITILGIVLAVPLIVIASLVWAVGAAIAFLAIADRLVGSDDGWLVPLVVAALINGALALTGIGGIVSFAVGATGFGAVLRDRF